MFKRDFWFVLGLFLFCGSSFGQTAGQIFIPSSGTSTFLDAGQDGYITTSGSALNSSSPELAQFESKWAERYQVITEPPGDAATGSICSQTDIVDQNNQKVAFYTGIYDPDCYPANNDGDEYFLYRLRIGGDPGSANFGYSVLIDTDLKYGAGIDPNANSSNQGFEVEIRFVNGGGSKGVYLDDVDGLSAGNTVASYGYLTHHQKSYALHTSSTCPKNKSTAVFVDVAVPLSDMTTHFGLTPSSSVRMVAATTTNGATALGSNISDLAGVDDDDPAYLTIEDAIQDLIDGQTSGGSALPVELISFRCKEVGKAVVVNWVTASEQNNDHFQVLRSNNGEEWEQIGWLPGAGDSYLRLEYEFYDQAPRIAGEQVLYRLKQVDFDGTEHLSKIASIGTNTKNLYGLAVYPNPSTGQVTIEEDRLVKAEMIVVDLMGKPVLTGLSFGDTFSLPPGQYLLLAQVDGRSEKRKIVITH